ncbi:hypothetical protein O1611_g3611 [Lasiodiplodia mahajangana]|uniref:Uncharacterized protein n=1 Tax=Lasiodiplodia mahajangana TaxID=1108764 RepID=A0ACC2JRJ4_9PEZI|nr:hypothetical protein O1611_g3611 [Lasiodiplodia mahajangana]
MYCTSSTEAPKAPKPAKECLDQVPIHYRNRRPYFHSSHPPLGIPNSPFDNNGGATSLAIQKPPETHVKILAQHPTACIVLEDTVVQDGDSPELLRAVSPKQNNIDPQLAMKVLANFDRAIAEVLQDKVRSRLTFKASLDTYRFCDEVWTFQLKNVTFKMENGGQIVSADRVKIVSCTAKPTGTAA